MALLDNTLAAQAHDPISPQEAKEALETGFYGDRAILALVTQDAEKAEAYESAKQWVSGFVTGSVLYQSPYTARFWENTMTPRSSIPFFTVASAVNSLVPQIINGLFYENPPFMVQKRPGTKDIEAQAVGAIQAYQLDELDFREELRLGCINGVLFGTSIWKWGWESFPQKRKIFKRKAPLVNIANPIPNAPNIQVHDADEDIEEEIIEEQVDRPFFEHVVNLRQILVDPTLNVPNISKAKYVVERMYMTWEDLDKLRDRPGFDIPPREKLLELFLPPREPVEMAIGEEAGKNSLWDMRSEGRYEQATADLFKQPLEVLWRWDDKKCAVILQKKAVICNDDNPYGKIPFLSVGWWDVPDGFYSIGLAKTIGSEQMLQQGIVNTWLDGTALNLNPVIVRVRGKNIPTQNIRVAPGKIVDVENKDDFRPMDRLPAVPEAAEHISLSQGRVDQLSGAGALNTSGSAAGHANLARSAEGARMIGTSGITAPDYVEKLASQVIVPFLYSMQEMNANLLPLSTMRRILDEELQHPYMAAQGDLLSLLNARVKFSILAGAKMQARRAMAAQLPILFQLVANEQTMQQLTIANKRVDMVELVSMLFESSDWRTKNDVIVDMTPEEAQRAAMNSPAAKIQAQAQAQSQLQQQKADNQANLIDQENQARAGREVLRNALEKSENPEVIGGEAPPNDQSFTQG